MSVTHPALSYFASPRTAVNNEFYVTPVFDVALSRGDHVLATFCQKMWGTGTPADYDRFLYEYSGEI